MGLLALSLSIVFVKQQSAKQLFDRCQDAVVTVRTDSGSGTGFVVGNNLTVVTCYHVIRDSPTSVSIAGSKNIPAILTAFDASLDVAVLKVQVPFRMHLSLSRTDMPAVGSRVYVIGTPLGFLDKTLSEGIVSGKRKVGKRGLIQISAAISHGSSGSPVILESGQVAGMASSSFLQGQSLNFAVCSSNIRSVLDSVGMQRKDAVKRAVSAITVDRIVGFEATTIRPATVYMQPSEASGELYSCSDGERLVIAQSTVPGWLTVSMATSDTLTAFGVKNSESAGYIKDSEVSVTSRIVKAGGLVPSSSRGGKGALNRIDRLIFLINSRELGMESQESKQLDALGSEVIWPVIRSLQSEPS